MRYSGEELEKESDFQDAGLQGLLGILQGLQPRYLEGAPVPEAEPEEISGRARSLRALSLVIEWLDAMADAQAKAEEHYLGKVKMAQEERTDAERAESAELVRQADEAARQPEEELHIERTGNPRIDELIERAEKRDRDSRDIRKNLPKDMRRGAELRNKMLEAMRALGDARNELYKWRGKRSRARRRSFWLHVLLLTFFGLLIGVVSVGLIQKQVDEKFNSVIATWIFAIAAWAVLEFLANPYLERKLIWRQLKLLVGETIASHVAWATLRSVLHLSGNDEELNLYQEVVPLDSL